MLGLGSGRGLSCLRWVIQVASEHGRALEPPAVAGEPISAEQYKILRSLDSKECNSDVS